MGRTLSFGLTVLALFIVSATAQEKKEMAKPVEPTGLKVGDPAPDFTLPYATKDTLVFQGGIKLSDFKGKKNVLVAFYPADWSGGCTKQVCSYRDNFSAFTDLNCEVIMISGDYVFSHQEWAKHHNLPFILASDHDHSVAKTYGSFMPEMGFNKRTVFLVDKAGIIRYINLKYNPGTPDDFEKLKAEAKKLAG